MRVKWVPAGRRATRIFGIAFVGLAASDVAANEIASDLGRLPVGTTIAFRNSEGPVFTHVVRGKDRRGHALEYVEGRDIGAGPIGRYRVDPDGQILHFEFADGRQVTDRPHDCARTRGECRFVEGRSGRPDERHRIATTRTGRGCDRTGYDDAMGETLKEVGLVVGGNGLNSRSWFRDVGERRMDLRLV